MADTVAQRVGSLLDLWSELALRHVALGSSCGCGAGGISLRLEDFELDIVDYLEDSGARSGTAVVESFFRARQDAAERPDHPLGQLLQDVQRDQVSPAVAEWMLPRLERTLRSFAELHGPKAQGGR